MGNESSKKQNAKVEIDWEIWFNSFFNMIFNLPWNQAGCLDRGEVQVAEESSLTVGIEDFERIHSDDIHGWGDR